MGKPKILITRAIPREVVSRLSERFELDYYERHTAIPRKLLLSKAKDKDGLLCVLTEKIDGELLAAAPGLKAVSTVSVGFDHVDVPACTQSSVVVCNTPGVLTETTADFTWALLMAVSRRVVEGDRYIRAGKYKNWDPMMLLGADVHGKTIGIVGFGRIGQAVAHRAAGFGMKILYYDAQRLLPAVEKSFGAEFCEMEGLLQRSDFVTLHTVLDASTQHLIDAKALKTMKRSAYLINAARGPIVDEKALVQALKAGTIAGAGLDVYEHEPKMAAGLSKLQNVVLAPHIASASVETRTKMAELAAQGLIDVLIHHKTPGNAVNPDAVGVRGQGQGARV